MVDFVADYWQSMRQRKPLPSVRPGYIHSFVPQEAPEEPENWESIFDDLESVVVSGVRETLSMFRSLQTSFIILLTSEKCFMFMCSHLFTYALIYFHSIELYVFQCIFYVHESFSIFLNFKWL